MIAGHGDGVNERVEKNDGPGTVSGVDRSNLKGAARHPRVH